MAASASRRDEMFAAVHHLREHCLFEVRALLTLVTFVCSNVVRTDDRCGCSRAHVLVLASPTERQVASGMPRLATRGGAASEPLERGTCVAHAAGA